MPYASVRPGDLPDMATQPDATDVSRALLVLYDEFRARARGRLYGERAGHSMGATDLANEVVLRLLQGDELRKARDLNQLWRSYSRAMQQVLIDHARRRKTTKRGGDLQRQDLDDLADDARRRAGFELELLGDALKCLSAQLPREAAVVEMRFFGGFKLPEIATALGVSLSTVERDCKFGIAWLRTHFREEMSHAPNCPEARP